jgi:hypothetical protein
MTKKYTVQDKMKILKVYFLENTSETNICQKYKITSKMLQEWQDDLFANGEQALRRAEHLKSKSPKTLFHRIFGQMLEGLLIPLNLEVFTELPVMSFPPEADVVLIRRNKNTWTVRQREFLPDGIRDSHARYVIIEFKYTESVNKKALQQALSYDYLFHVHKGIKKKDMQTFLVSSKTPNEDFMSQMGFRQVPGREGVYQSDNEACNAIKILVLNELPNTYHNVYFKCFASQKDERFKAFKMIQQNGLIEVDSVVKRLMFGLWQVWFNFKGGKKMDIQLTPEQMQRTSEVWGKCFLRSLSPKELLEYISLEEILKDVPINERLKDVPIYERLKDVPVYERLKGVPVNERLKGVPVNERLKGVPVNERLKGVPVNERLKGVPVNERLKGVSVNERLKGVPIDQLKAYYESIISK